ncbi:MAG: phage tail assembly chaperone, partial [Myxococcales bacterium]|nr:phage tail assembly chaperone [Myxococcales bacterium]
MLQIAPSEFWRMTPAETWAAFDEFAYAHGHAARPGRVGSFSSSEEGELRRLADVLPAQAEARLAAAAAAKR